MNQWRFKRTSLLAESGAFWRSSNDMDQGDENKEVVLRVV
jgi:hypothetical protein